MALINCKDCNSEISDSAESCPKCGAPVPKTIGPNEEQCPHCMATVHQDAIKCPGCRAVKGYLYDSKYGVAGKTLATGWSIFIFVLGLILMLTFNTFWMLVSLLLLPSGLYGLYRVFITGPRWFASAHGD